MASHLQCPVIDEVSFIGRTVSVTTMDGRSFSFTLSAYEMNEILNSDDSQTKLVDEILKVICEQK